MSCGKVKFWWCTGHKGNGTFLRDGGDTWKCLSCGHKRESSAWPKQDDSA